MAKNGSAKEPVSVSLNITVLSRLDKYCLKTDLNRSIKKFLASEMADDPSFWDTVYDQCDSES